MPLGGRGQGLVSLFRDLKGEIRKVNWPTPRQAANMTAVIAKAIDAGPAKRMDVFSPEMWQLANNGDV